MAGGARVFINDIDAYSSGRVAQFLSSCVVGEPLKDEGHRRATFTVVGTVADVEEKLSFAAETYSFVSREEQLQCLMQCDVIVYNITESAGQIDDATWAVSALHSEIEHFAAPKIFILLSTIMTWASTKPADPSDPEVPLTEDDYRRRRPHPNFKQHTSTEKLVLKLGKTKKSKLATYVVAAGLQYGMGETWLGECSSIPVFGPGTNIIPTIHIHDLSRVVQNIIDHRPKTHYFMAVDESSNTLEDIVNAVASALGSGKTKKVSMEEASGSKQVTETDLHYLSVNLRAESVFLKDRFNLHWECNTGIVENILSVVEEFRQSRQLLPRKICLFGPPAVGKSSVAAKLCRYYKLQHINVTEVINEKIRELEEMLEENERTSENEELMKVAEEQRKTLNRAQNDGHLDEKLVTDIMREKLNSVPCRNKGFVLDGFPTTFTQAKDLFHDENMASEDIRSAAHSCNEVLIPEFIFSLDATDEFLKDRVRNLPQSEAEEKRYTQDEFTERLVKFREALTEDPSVLDYFDELEIHPEHIAVDGVDDCENVAVLEKIIETVGQPLRYSMTPAEIEEERMRKEEEWHQQLKQEEVEKELREIEDNAKMAALLEEWKKNMTEVRMQEQELSEARSVPMRHFLMKYVMPTVMQGLVHCCRVKPEDPVEFLAEYLFQNNSED